MNVEKKINVYHLVESLGGGVFSYFKSLDTYFANDTSFNTTIIFSDKRKEIDKDTIQDSFSDSTRMIPLDMSSKIAPFKDIRSIVRLIKLLRKDAPDIIHLHSSKAGFIGRFAVLFIRPRPLTLYTPHGYAFLRQDIGKAKKILFKSIESVMSKLSNGITVACGDTEYEHACKLGRAKLVRNGITPGYIRKFKKENSEGGLVLGILGRITYARNPTLFNELAMSMPDIKFIWIGGGELRHLLTAPNIEITGWFADRTEGIKQLSRLSIYLQTSLWEGLPISILEAMAMELPVMATNIIGNKDAVVHGETGFLFEGKDDFKKYFEILIDQNKRKMMGSNGYQRILKIFNSELNFGHLRSLYFDLLVNTAE